MSIEETGKPALPDDSMSDADFWAGDGETPSPEFDLSKRGCLKMTDAIEEPLCTLPADHKGLCSWEYSAEERQRLAPKIVRMDYMSDSGQCPASNDAGRCLGLRGHIGLHTMAGDI